MMAVPEPRRNIVIERARVVPAEHAALVRRETTSNTLATALIAAVVTWLLFRSHIAIAPLSAPPGGIFGILPGTFNFTLLVTIVLTLITRKRVSRQQLRRLASTEGAALGSSLPGNVVARALVLAVCVTATCVLCTYGLVMGTARLQWLPAQWSFAGMEVFFVTYFVLLSLLVTPIVVWRALRD